MIKCLLKGIEQIPLLTSTQAEGTQFPHCFSLGFLSSPALRNGTLKKCKNRTFSTTLITLGEVQKWFHVFGSFKILLHTQKVS